MKQLVWVALALAISLAAWIAGVFGASLLGYALGRQTAGVPMVEGDVPASRLEWLRVTSGLQRWEFSTADQFAASLVSLTERELPPGIVPTVPRLLALGALGAVPMAVLLLWWASRPVPALRLRLLNRGLLRLIVVCGLVWLILAGFAGLSYYGWMSLRDTFTPRAVFSTPGALESLCIGACAGLTVGAWLPWLLGVATRLSVRAAEREALPWCTGCGHPVYPASAGGVICPECGTRRTGRSPNGGSPLDPPLRVRILGWAALTLASAAALVLAADVGCVRARLRGGWEVGETGDYIMYWPVTDSANNATALTLRFSDGVAVLRLGGAAVTETAPQGASIKEVGTVTLDAEWTSMGSTTRQTRSVTSELAPGLVKPGVLPLGSHSVKVVPHSWRTSDGRLVVEVAVNGPLVGAGVR